jgi:hypothetical protein
MELPLDSTSSIYRLIESYDSDTREIFYNNLTEVATDAFVCVDKAIAPCLQTMKFFLCLSVAVLAVAVSAAEDKKDATATDRPKTFRRLIPADVLRGKYPEHNISSGRRNYTVYFRFFYNKHFSSNENLK